MGSVGFYRYLYLPYTFQNWIRHGWNICFVPQDLDVLWEINGYENCWALWRPWTQQAKISGGMVECCFFSWGYCQLVINCWFALVVLIPRIPLWKGLLLRGIPRLPNRRAPNQQWIIGSYFKSVLRTSNGLHRSLKQWKKLGCLGYRGDYTTQ